MWELVKKLISRRDGEVTVLLLDDEEPEISRSFRIESFDVIRAVGLLVALSVLITTIIFFITPIGSLYQSHRDEGLRQDVLSVTEKVLALEDSLRLRNRQLVDLKRVLVQTPDTVFPRAIMNRAEQGGSFPTAGMGDNSSYEMLTREELLHADLYRRATLFPAPFPIDGTVSQGFNPGERHFGIDIAARTGTEFQAIADGTVVYADWTVNYGYVLYLQHADGYLSVYKHGASLYRRTGENVLRGDLLGTVGDRGALSFGSHLHFEIWKDGVPQTPQLYLLN